MSNYRKFWLVNANNEIYHLTNISFKHFLNTPNGLGFNKIYTSQSIGDSELIYNQTFEMQDITGEIVFYGGLNGDIYQEYKKFIDFIKFKPLQLHYLTPNEVGSYYSDIVIVSISKSEIETDKTLKVPFVFHRTSQWLNSKVNSFTFYNANSESGKHYNLIRDYHYAGTTLSNIKLVNEGTDDVPFVIEIIGKVDNPIFSLFDNDGIKYGKIELEGSFDYIRIDSDDLKESMQLELKGTVLANPQNYQNLSKLDGEVYITWCKLRVGENTGVFTCGNIDTFDGYINISYKESRATV